MIVFGETPFKLSVVHPALLDVWERFKIITTQNIILMQTSRSAVQQKVNVAKGVSQTPHSRHVISNNKSGKACAMDVAPISPDGKIILWKRIELFKTLNTDWKLASISANIPIEWGGNWKTFKDYDHWQLPWATYP